MKNSINKIERIELALNKTLIGIGSFLLVLMMTLACVNVVFRNFGFPIKGTFEFMGFFSSVAFAFALGRTQKNGQHISVDVLLNLFPKKLQKILNIIGLFFSMCFFLIATVEIIKRGNSLLRVNELSETLMIIYYPFVYAVSLGVFVIVITLFVDILKIGDDL